MKYLEFFERYLPVVVLVTAILLLSILGFNASRQARLQSRALAAKATIAVFLKSDSAIDSVTSGLMATSLVARADFFNKEAVYKNMTAAGSPLKAMLVPGENPFTPYGLIYPKKINPADAKALSDAVLKMDGVQDVRFDEGLFFTRDRLSTFGRFYKAGVVLVFILFSLVAVFRVIRYIIGRPCGFLMPGTVLLCGILAGLLAAGSYVLLMRYCSAEPVGVLSMQYLLVVLSGGMLLSIALGLKR